MKRACVFVAGQRNKLEACLVLIVTQGTENTSLREGLQRSTELKEGKISSIAERAQALL